MNSSLKVLAALLIVQLVLWVFLQSTGTGQTEESPALLEASLFEGDGLHLKIDDAEGNNATLEKLDEGWQLASGLPADAKKADELVAKLTGLTLGWPASTSADSHQRFEVADDNFQRKLEVISNEGASTLYFGTSPGYLQAHARGDGDSVYAVKLANHEMPALSDDWLDKSLLQSTGEVSGVTWGESLSVSKEPNGWMLGDETGDIAGIQRAVDNLTKLQVLGVLETAPGAPAAGANEVLIRDGSGEYRLSFWARPANNDHVIVSTRYPGEAFRLANFVAEQLVPEAADLTAPTLLPEQLPTEGEAVLDQ